MNSNNGNSLEITPKAIISRKEAEALGRDTYYTGKPCGHGHLSERYVTSGVCVACSMEWHTKQVASGELAARAKRYREANPDRVAAQGGWWAAKKRGAVLPDDFKTVKSLLMAIEGFYREARSLREETGVMYHVDHIVPLGRGGQHHPSNLRVITSAFNSAKRNKTDIECLESIFSNTWKGPIDAEVLTTLVESVAYEFASLGASASIQATA